MRVAIAVVGLTFLVANPQAAWTDEQPVKLSAEQQEVRFETTCSS
jgi:hypothetical protein